MQRQLGVTCMSFGSQIASDKGFRTELMLGKLYRLYLLWKSKGKPAR